jgi:hypothetical protein
VLPADVLQRDYLPHDICALCSAIMQSPAAVALLRRRFARDAALRRKVALLRDVLYGETDSLLQLNDQ